jgi:Uma2 family endonuclease
VDGLILSLPWGQASRHNDRVCPAGINVMALPKATDHRLTYADYRKWPAGERWELIDGVAYARAPAPTISHQTMIGQLFRQIDQALDGASCRALIAPVDILLSAASDADDQATTVVQPDILVVCDPAKVTENNIHGAPDWIIEVLSPATARHDHLTKRALYERAGVREYWLVHPVDRVITLYTLKDGIYGGPEIAEMAGERSPAIFPEIVIHWQAYRFAIDPQAAFQGTDHPSHPTAERRLELLRVEGSEDAQKRFLGGNAVLEHQELTQPIFLLTSPMGDVFDGVTVGEHGCDSRHENLQEVMQRPIAGFARVVHFSETAHQACPPRQSHFCRPKDESRTDFARVYKLLA